MGVMEFFKKRKCAKRLEELKSSARYILHVEDEILQDKAKDSLRSVVDEASSVDPKDSAAVDRFAASASARIEAVYPRSGWFHTVRDWLDVLAVALAVAFGIRALYLQPFKIPTSSMQPTLFGIHYVQKDAIPELGSALDYLLFSAKRVKAVSSNGGELFFNSIAQSGQPSYYGRSVQSPYAPLWPAAAFSVGNDSGKDSFVLPGAFKQYEDLLLMRLGGQVVPRSFKPGDAICDGWVSLGDHLFVDRFSIHFLGLHRGDVVVFTTEGINYQPQQLGGFYYIKRLVGMPGDVLKIESRTLLVKPKGSDSFKPVYELSPKFSKLYAGKGGYQRHQVPDYRSEDLPYVKLKEEGQEIIVPEGCYFMMGDNTTNSLDSRYWGFVPRANIVGTAGFVFWPLSRRWGLADSAGAVDSPTALPSSMWLQ